MKKTVVVGATDNPSRYAYIAAQMLTSHGHEIVPVSIKKGHVAGKEILDLNDNHVIEDVDTVTLYVGTKNQEPWYDFILNLNPKRIIFNPGTENPELETMAEEKGIETIEGCTLVMLRMGFY
jgi:uncharacterized protein